MLQRSKLPHQANGIKSPDRLTGTTYIEEVGKKQRKEGMKCAELNLMMRMEVKGTKKPVSLIRLISSCTYKEL